MKRLSDKKRRVQANIRRIILDKLERNGNRCFLSGSSYMLTPAHLIRQSYSAVLQDDKRNIIPLNQVIHDMMDNGKFKELYEKYPWKCQAIIDRMFSLDHFYTNRFLRNNNMESLIR